MTYHSDSKMDAFLKQLLEELELVGEDHEELYDTDVRERMSDAICNGFLKPKAGYLLIDDFGMYSGEANCQIKAAIDRYIRAANERAEEIGLTAPNQRLTAFQNQEVCTDGEQYPDDFFGWTETIE
jgi:hypothetical protein